MIAVKSSGKDWQGFYQLDHVATPGILFDKSKNWKTMRDTIETILFDTLEPKDVVIKVNQCMRAIAAFQDHKSKINLSYYKEYNIFISKLFKCIFLVGV